jgi:hypothetical protein
MAHWEKDFCALSPFLPPDKISIFPITGADFALAIFHYSQVIPNGM